MNRPIETGALGQMFLSAREAFPSMIHTPGVAFRCGILALQNVAMAAKVPDLGSKHLREIPSPS